MLVPVVKSPLALVAYQVGGGVFGAAGGVCGVWRCILALVHKRLLYSLPSVYQLKVTAALFESSPHFTLFKRQVCPCLIDE